MTLGGRDAINSIKMSPDNFSTPPLTLARVYNNYRLLNALIKADPKDKLGLRPKSVVMKRHREEIRNKRMGEALFYSQVEHAVILENIRQHECYLVVRNPNANLGPKFAEDPVAVVLLSGENEATIAYKDEASAKSLQREVKQCVEHKRGWRTAKKLDTERLHSVVRFIEESGVNPAMKTTPKTTDQKGITEDEVVEISAKWLKKFGKGEWSEADMVEGFKKFSTKEGQEKYWERMAGLCSERIVSMIIEENSWREKYKRAGGKIDRDISGALNQLSESKKEGLRNMVDTWVKVGGMMGKTLGEMRDKLAKGCGKVSQKLGMDGEKVEAVIRDGLNSAKDGLTSLGKRVVAIVGHPITAGLLGGSMLVAQSLNKAGQLGAPSQIATELLGAAALTIVATPLVKNLQSWRNADKSRIDQSLTPNKTAPQQKSEGVSEIDTGKILNVSENQDISRSSIIEKLEMLQKGTEIAGQASPPPKGPMKSGKVFRDTRLGAGTPIGAVI